MILAAQVERGVLGQQVAGLFNPPLAAEHQTGQDQRLRPGAAFDQPAVDQQLVGAALQALTLRGALRSRPSASLRSRPSASVAARTMSRAGSPAAIICLAWLS